jgi:GntR family transcriptional regulator
MRRIPVHDLGAPTRTAVITPGPLPKHAQLRAILAELVTTRLGPDAPIPSERELMTEYGVSRATVRKAIDGLVNDGVLQRTHGKGTFVSRPRLESRLHLASFSQDMRRRGLTPSTRLLEVTDAVPPAEVAQSLGLHRRERAWRVQRVRLADGEPIALEHGWYSLAHLPGLDREDLSGSLYELLAARFGLRIDHAEQTLWTEPAEGEVARLLAVPAHSPLLVFRRESRAGALPVEHVVSHYRGDRYQLHMSLSQDDGPTPHP